MLAGEVSEGAGVHDKNLWLRTLHLLLSALHCQVRRDFFMFRDFAERHQRAAVPLQQIAKLCMAT